MSTARGKGWHPTATRNAWLPVGDLLVDPDYERPLNQTKVGKLARDFDPDAVGSIYVSERKDGRIFILDGQHRVQAVLRLWGPKERVPCLIYTGLSHEDEARLFVEFNEHRTKPRPMDLFRAKIKARDASALSIMKTVEDAGFEIDNAKVSCISHLTAVHDNGGPDVLFRTMKILGEAWGYEGASAHGLLVHAVGLVVARFRSTLDDKRIVKVLRDTTPGQIIAKARIVKEANVDSTRRSVKFRLDTTIARIIISVYNRGLRTESKMLTWDERPSMHFWDEVVDDDVEVETS